MKVGGEIQHMVWQLKNLNHGLTGQVGVRCSSVDLRDKMWGHRHGTLGGQAEGLRSWRDLSRRARSSDGS